MKWTRERPGVYTSGPHRIERVADCHPCVWHASGPGRPRIGHQTKAEAQAEVERAARDRVADPDTVPVVGDHVEIVGANVWSGRRGQVSTIIKGARHIQAGDEPPLYCLHLARGKRLCLFRHEITVVVP